MPTLISDLQIIRPCRQAEAAIGSLEIEPIYTRTAGDRTGGAEEDEVGAMRSSTIITITAILFAYVSILMTYAALGGHPYRSLSVDANGNPAHQIGNRRGQ
jgi:hypothetical protein